jgi:hypothetical protein
MEAQPGLRIVRVTVEGLETTGIEARRSPDDAVDFVALRQQ